MSVARSMPVPSVREQVSEEEWQTRVDLAAFYRLYALFGWTDLVFTHISARVPDNHREFLINPYGLAFEEVTASSLVKVDVDGEIVMPTPYTVNAAGFTIHSAVHIAREDVACVAHTHTVAGMAVSAQKCGLLPLTQTALAFYDRLSYHGYEGVALDLDERDSIVKDLGKNLAMILANHGLLACGRTVAEAFSVLHMLEMSCASQIAAQAGGELVLPPPEVCRKTAEQHWGKPEDNRAPLGGLAWPAMLRKLDRAYPGYDA